MWNLKYGTNEIIYKTEKGSYTQRTDMWLPGERKERWTRNWELQAIAFRTDKQGPKVCHRE